MPKKADPKYVVEIDLKELIEDFVWKKFMKQKSVLKCFYSRKNYVFEIRWSFFSINEFQSEFKVPKDKIEQKMEHKTKYTNTLKESQKCVLNVHSSHTESEVVKLQHNLSIGGNVKLQCLGLNLKLERNKCGEQKQENVISWSETSELNLDSKSSAEVVVKHANRYIEKIFQTKTLIQLKPTHPGWGVPVIVRRKSNMKSVFEHEITKLGELFEVYKDCEDLVKIEEDSHEIEFNDGTKQLYDQVYVYSRGSVEYEVEERSVSLDPVRETVPTNSINQHHNDLYQQIQSINTISICPNNFNQSTPY
ncbi:uncharacterized protein LOC115218515 [Argonauta hians]